MQKEISDAIADQMKIKLIGEKIIERKGITQNPEALDLYMQGRFFWNQNQEKAVLRSIEYFEKALDKDPQYALAESARDMGASVILISGPVALANIPEVKIVKVETANDMYIEMNKFLGISETNIWSLFIPYILGLLGIVATGCEWFSKKALVKLGNPVGVRV